MLRSLSSQLAIACVALASLLTGCGGSGGSVANLAGNVTLGGKPLPPEAKAFVMFTQGTGKEANKASAPIVDSKYNCADVPQGAVTVFFDITQPVGPMKKSERTGQEFQETKNLVPGQFATGMQLQVAGDKADQNFDL